MQTTVVEACEALREKLSEIKGLGPAAQYGLFLADEDPKRGVWLESGRTLEHYLLRENVSIFNSFHSGGVLAVFGSIPPRLEICLCHPFATLRCSVVMLSRGRGLAENNKDQHQLTNVSDIQFHHHHHLDVI